VADWGFLTNHARVLVCIAHDPGARLRDIAASLGITERSAHGIITDLTQAGYVIKQKDGRRNRYQIEGHLPLPEPGTREPPVGEILAILLGNTDGPASPADGTDAATAGTGGHDGPGGPEDDAGPGADRPGRDLLPGDQAGRREDRRHMPGPGRPAS